MGTKISSMSALTGATVDPDADTLVIVDNSATETKKITLSDAMRGAVLDLYSADLEGGDVVTDSDIIRWPGTNDPTNYGPTTIWSVDMDFSGTPDPVICMGYNCQPNGVETNANDPHSAGWYVEGHWHDGACNSMEIYAQFTQGGAGNDGRPFFSKYDKDNNLIKETSITGSATGGVTFTDDSNAGGAYNAVIKKNQFELLAQNAAANSSVLLRGASTRTAGVVFYPNGATATADSCEILAQDASGDPQFRLTTAGKGQGAFFTDGGVNNVVHFSLGTANKNAQAVIYGASNPDALPLMQLWPSATITAPVVEVNQGAGVYPWRLYRDGHIKVRPSGGSESSPSTGAATTASMGAPAAWNNKPGSNITSTVPDKWFPMLDTAGALFWVPGFADA